MTLNREYIDGKRHKPFIIAEMSGNHNQSLDRAMEIVEAAGSCGVDALKSRPSIRYYDTFDERRRVFY